MPDRLRVAIVGAGYFGQFHYDAWSRMPEVEIAAIVVRNPEAAAETASKWGRAGAPAAGLHRCRRDDGGDPP